MRIIAWILINISLIANLFCQNTGNSFELMLESPYTTQWAKTIELSNESILINNSNYDSEYIYSHLTLLSSYGTFIKEKICDISFYNMINISPDSILVVGAKNKDSLGVYLYLIVFDNDLNELQRDSIFHNQPGFIDIKLTKGKKGLYLTGYYKVNTNNYELLGCKINKDASFPVNIFISPYPGHSLQDVLILSDKILVFTSSHIVLYYDMNFTYLGYNILNINSILFNIDIHQDYNNSIIIGGTSIGMVDGIGRFDVSMAEIDTNFNLLNSIKIESEYIVNNAAEDECIAPVENGFYLLGDVNYNFQEENSSFLHVSKINEDFEIVWKIDIKRSVNTIAYHITPTKSNGCIITANQVYNWYWDSDILIYKIDSVGNYTTIRLNDFRKNKSNVYPNPGTEYFKIELESELKESSLIIRDLSGQIIYKCIISGKINKINTSYFKSGFYTWEIIKDGKLYASGKWIKQ